LKPKSSPPFTFPATPNVLLELTYFHQFKQNHNRIKYTVGKHVNWPYLCM